MVYDGKGLTARVRSMNPDGTPMEEKDTKVLSGMEKIYIYFFKSHQGWIQKL